VESIALHPGGSLLAYRLRDGAVWLWDTASHSEGAIARVSSGNPVFHPDGRSLVFAVEPGQFVTRPLFPGLK
jgi:hypothetical protein